MRRLWRPGKGGAPGREGGGARELLAGYGADAYWIYPDGSALWTEGLEPYFHR